MFARDGFEAFSRDMPALGFLRVAPSRVDAWDHRVSSALPAANAPG